MFYFIKDAFHHTVSFLMWLVARIESEGFRQSSRVLEAVKSVSAMLPRSSGSTIDNNSSPLPMMLARPTVVRASTSATLVHVDVDIFSLNPLQKPLTNSLKDADLAEAFLDHLHNKSVASFGDFGDSPEQHAPIVSVIPQSTVVQGSCEKRKASKRMAARWAPDPLERGISVHRPATGVERLARLQRLKLII